MKLLKRQPVGIIGQFMAAGARLHCAHRRNSSRGPSRTVVDDAGSLAITAWTCALCGDLVEEIRMLSRNGTSRLFPIRDAITPPASGRRSTDLSGVW
jgi:hypothetical protein